MPVDPERLHDEDWRLRKPDDTALAGSGRFVRILELVEALRPARVLDIGCGSGFLARRIRERWPATVVDGVDISSVALERARPYLEHGWQVDLDRGDVPAASAGYDLVIASEVIEHLYDAAHALGEMARLMAPGGHAIVTVPNVAYWRYRLDLVCGRLPLPADDDRHLHQFTARSLRDQARRHGLSVEALSGHGVRFAALARSWPALFSDTLIVLFRTKPATPEAR
jgi:2-polyprenyl-3-methyl-5-hydroxy-6-metoxy-1,4-benzoquinol methylase